MDVTGVVVVEAQRGEKSATSRLEAGEHVANRPIIHHVLDALSATGVQDVVIASSAELAGEVRECLSACRQGSGARLRFVEQRAPVDLGGALNLAAPLVGEGPCIVHLANGLIDEPLAPLVDHVRYGSPDVVLAVHQGPAPDEHLSPATQGMLHIAELDPERNALAMAGVCLFGRSALGHVSAASWRSGSDLDLTVVAERVQAAGGSFHVLPVNAWRRYAGDPLDLLELNRIALDRLDSHPYRPSNNGNRIEGRVWIHESATVRASVIVGPTAIGAEAHVADAYIGPYTSIGAGARIEGAEIERSIVASGASIMHVGGRLVASVVGRDARVFRDFSLPRALRLRVGDGTEVALC